MIVLATVPAALAAIVVAVLGFIRSQRVDATVEQAGIATGRSSELNLALAGMSTLVESLQADNRTLRDEVGRLTQRLNVVVAECDELGKRLLSLRRKYGDNGDPS